MAPTFSTESSQRAQLPDVLFRQFGSRIAPDLRMCPSATFKCPNLAMHRYRVITSSVQPTAMPKTTHILGNVNREVNCQYLQLLGPDPVRTLFKNEVFSIRVVRNCFSFQRMSCRCHLPCARSSSPGLCHYPSAHKRRQLDVFLFRRRHYL